MMYLAYSWLLTSPKPYISAYYNFKKRKTKRKTESIGMKLRILFGQRICQYDGQYLPEALEIEDECTRDLNPEWFQERIKYYESSKEFDSIRAMSIKISDEDIEKCLYPHEIEMEPEILKG